MDLTYQQEVLLALGNFLKKNQDFKCEGLTYRDFYIENGEKLRKVKGVNKLSVYLRESVKDIYGFFSYNYTISLISNKTNIQFNLLESDYEYKGKLIAHRHLKYLIRNFMSELEKILQSD